ncbi:MAG: hypothetical protein AB8G96_03155 [Phycisphaerales bacterium]
MNENVNLRVEFDGRAAATSEATGRPIVVAAGDRLSGTVFMQMQNSVKVRAIRLVAEWRTRGRGDTDKDVAHDVVLVDGPAVTGEHVVPFDVPLPVAPLTYHGNLIKVEWQLRVRFDRPFARDWWHDVPIDVV